MQQKVELKKQLIKFSMRKKKEKKRQMPSHLQPIKK